MDDPQVSPVLPRGLRWLQALVIILTLTMILAVITIVFVLVTRAPQVFAGSGAPILPERLVLPDGVTATAVTQGRGWFAVVTNDDRILIFDRAGALRQEVAITKGLAD